MAQSSRVDLDHQHTVRKEKPMTDGDMIDRVPKLSIRFEGNRDVVDVVDRVEELANSRRIN